MFFICRKFVALFLLSLFVFQVNAFALTVGVYTGTGSSGSKGVVETLKGEKGLSLKTFKAITAANLKGVDVLIISNAYRLSEAPQVRGFVQKGGGVLMTHDAAGSDRNTGEFSGESTFPELVKTTGLGRGGASRNNVIKVVRNHPITKGLVGRGKKAATFKHSFNDHVSLLPTDDRFVLLEDVQVQDEFTKKRFGGTQRRWDRYLGGDAVLVAAPLGKGRVVLSGILFGLDAKDRDTKVTGAELKLLKNSIKWLGGKAPLSMPKAASKNGSSKYSRASGATYPEYAANAIEVVTSLPKSDTKKDQGYEVEFTLPASAALGKSIPVMIPVSNMPGGAYRAVMLDRGGKAAEQFPAQVELVGGKQYLVFVAAFSQRKNRCQFSADNKANISVEVAADGRLAQVRGPHFQMLLAVENCKPTIQSLNLHNQGWFRSWKGLERNDITSPVLRLAHSEWPFSKLVPSVDHEKGLAMPSLDGQLTSVYRYPAHVEIKVGSGKINIYNTGQMRLEGFEKSGRIATIAFDGYKQANTWIEEAVSYDMPGLKNAWVWAVRKDNFAVGGDFEVTDKMGETGLAPGMERQIKLTGKGLVATTSDKLEQLQVQPVAVQARGTIKTITAIAEIKSAGAITLPARRVRMHKLRKMRGKDGFYDILPQPVELYVNEWARDPAVAKWKISDPSVALMSFDNKGEFKTELADGPGDFIVVQDMDLDPHKEDWDVARRFFLKPADGIKLPISKDIAIVGFNADGKEQVRIPVRFEAAVTLPVGIYTYGNSWAFRATEVESIYWPRLMRDVAVNNMDFVIHRTPIEDKYLYDSGERIIQRLKRYGLWCVPNLDYLWQTWNKPAVINGNTIDIINQPLLEERYRKAGEMFRDDNNILVWHLSEEVVQKAPGHKLFDASYGFTKTIYELWKEHGDSTRPAFHLASEIFTPFDVAFKHMTTDIFVWDPYHAGAGQALAEGKKIDKGWRKPKGKPAWITLRSSGPNFCDVMDLWLDIRRRSIAAFQGNVDGLNYYEYAHWNHNMEQFTYYAVIPGEKGPVATPRWQAIGEVTKDIQLLTTAEHLLEEYRGAGRAALVKKFDMAVQNGSNGNFYKMRTSLRLIIERLQQKG